MNIKYIIHIYLRQLKKLILKLCLKLNISDSRESFIRFILLQLKCMLCITNIQTKYLRYNLRQMLYYIIELKVIGAKRGKIYKKLL